MVADAYSERECSYLTELGQFFISETENYNIDSLEVPQYGRNIKITC